MRFIWHSLRIAGACLVLVAGVGCSGINASHSVSPATFFLPGLMHYQPGQSAPLEPAPAADLDGRLAQAR